MKIIVFPIKQADIYPTEIRGDIFYLPSDFADQSFKRSIYDWHSTDKTILNNTFKQQIVKNMETNEFYKFHCDMLLLNPDPNLYHTKNKLHTVKGLPIEVAHSMCVKHMRIRKDIMDTFERDSNMFMQQGKTADDPPVNAVVLLNNDDVYVGHIYTWATGANCYAFGIRGRVDKSFTDDKESIIGPLFEGVRQFAMENGCNKIRVPNPLPIMKKILSETYQFSIVNSVPVSEIKNDYAGYTYKSSTVVYEKEV